MPPTPKAIATDFGAEYEAEQDRLMRKRMLLYLVVSLSLSVLGFLLVLGISLIVSVLLGTVGSDELGQADSEAVFGLVTMWGGVALYIPTLVAYGWALQFVRTRVVKRATALRIVYWIIVGPTIISVVGSALLIEIAQLFLESEPHVDLGSSTGWNSAVSVFLIHFFACVFLPWTPRESVRPMVPIVATASIVSLYAMWGDWAQALLVIVVTFGVMVPGTLLTWAKTARFSKRFVDRMLRDSYGTMKHELSAARQIHDAMFPDPVTEGPIRVDYRYEPMRQIGGDYVFVRRSEHAVDVVLIDVTGHGVGAALTVNRLHGEVSRQLAERPDCGPGELLRGLNRYLHITLARHSVYATAFCCRVETQSDELRYASAGHPPAYIVGPERACERLDSTSYLLGVVGVDDFDAGEKSQRLAEGDRLIAYTDGATEAMDGEGRQFRIAGIESTLDGLRSARGTPAQPESWLDAIVAAVEQHRVGAATDDTLIVEVQRASAQ